MTEHVASLAPTLAEMQSTAYERIAADAERYSASDHAVAVYVQTVLFTASRELYGSRSQEDLRDRAALASESKDTLVLFPHEFTELRVRAAYHGAGLATERSQDIPRAVRYRLSDNLDNYPPKIEYEQMHAPWTYKFELGALRGILKHDFTIAAEDNAEGDLGRLCRQPEE